MNKYIRNNTHVFNVNYHIIFCPEYRKPILFLIDKNMIIECFKLSCVKYNCQLIEFEIMPDHIHLFIKVININIFNISNFMKHIKGFSSYTIRNNLKYMKKYKHLWSPSYFIESIGNISESTIINYIKNQTINVKSNYKYKNMI